MRVSALPFSPAVADGSGLVRGAHPGTAPGLERDRPRRPHADPGAHGLGQDARGVPVGDRPAQRRAAPRSRPPHPGAVHLAAAGARGRRREEPPRAAARASAHAAERLGRRRSRARARSVGVRTGDTPAARSAPAHAPHPPDILITTPESLYLMLTSSARETLRGVAMGDRRRDPRAGRHQARRAPRALARAARAARRHAAAAHRSVGDAASARGDRAVPGWARRATARPRPVTIVDAGPPQADGARGRRAHRGHGPRSGSPSTSRRAARPVGAVPRGRRSGRRSIRSCWS